MSEQPELSRVPEWTLGWRMRRALEHAGITADQMAGELGMHRSAITRWTHDKVVPREIYLKQWALRCGVSLDWLKDGDSPPPPPAEEVPPGGFEPPTHGLGNRCSIP
jgi:transcriptional regulator with XRE-family HTH domain